MSLSKFKVKRVRLNWYAVVYQTKDQELIDMFWRFYKHHSLSKNRAAFAVLKHYYSTTSKVPPLCVVNAFSFNRDRQVIAYDLWESEQ